MAALVMHLNAAFPGHILYIGELERGSTCRDRMLALRDLGFDVQPFDTTSYLRRGPRVIRSLAHRFNIGPRIRSLNADLSMLRPVQNRTTIVWNDKGKWIYPETLTRLRHIFGGPLVHFTPDPQLKLHRSRYFNQSIPVYDVLVTTKPFEIEDYRKAGARRLMLIGQSYDEKRARRGRFRPELASDVCFVGHRERHYARIMRYVPAAEVMPRIWGPGWKRTRLGFVVGEGLWGEDYYDGLSSARLGLGLLSKRIPESSTTRTFEIPASGALLLAERTPEHQRYFEEGKEAEFFDDPEEMCDKIRFYTRNEVARVRVARAGRERCRKAGYGNRARLKAVLQALSGEKDYSDLRFQGAEVLTGNWSQCG